jgi:serine/threonine protein kinase
MVELEAFQDAKHDRPELKAHIEQCARCRALVDEIKANNELMDRLLRTDLRTGGGAGVEPAPALPHDAIAGYEIHEELMRGGQGAVYRATHHATRRTVALKVLLSGAFATSRQRHRFEREIELVASLDHPAIVTVYDSGVTSDGRHYLAMQFIDGAPLDAWAERRRRDARGSVAPTLDEMLTLFDRIADGVSHAHQHGVLHRDLKPANILIDAEGEPHILDFGIAKPVGREREVEAGLVTEEGAFLGTLAYAAPEQVSGAPDRVDVRSDVYSLGVMLYELLSGGRPYPLEGGLSEIIESIVTAEPKRLRGAPDALLRIDDELDTIVMKTLAKDPDRRYQSVSALSDDLKRYRTGRPIEAKRDSGWYVLRKTMRRHRMKASAAGAMIIMLIVFSIVIFIQSQRTRIESEKVKQINLFLEDTLGSVESARSDRELTVRELLDEAVQWIDIALSDQPEVAASIRNTVGGSYRNLGLFEQAETQLTRALEIRRELFDESHSQVSRSLSALALLRRDQGRLDEAEQMLRNVLASRRISDGADSLGVAYTEAILALVLKDLGAFDEAESLLNDSLRIRRLMFPEASADVAMCVFSLAQVKDAAGDEQRAEALYRQALELRRIAHPRAHPSVARSLEALARRLIGRDQPEEAHRLLTECEAIQRESLAEDHWRIAVTMARRGACLAMMERYDEAETMLLEAVSTLTDTLGPAGDETLEARRQLVALYEAQGRSAEAEVWRARIAREAPASE